jgi:hypothetical protein
MVAIDCSATSINILSRTFHLQDKMLQTPPPEDRTLDEEFMEEMPITAEAIQSVITSVIL